MKHPLRASHLTGGECGSGSFKPCHPVWRLWWRRWGYVKVLQTRFSSRSSRLRLYSQTFRCCNSLCRDGRQWNSALPHGSQWYLPSGRASANVYETLYMAPKVFIAPQSFTLMKLQLRSLPSSLTQRRSALGVREPNRVCKRFESLEIIPGKIFLTYLSSNHMF